MSVVGVEWANGLGRTLYQEPVRWQGTIGYCRTRANAVLYEQALLGATPVCLRANGRRIHNEPNVPRSTAAVPPTPLIGAGDPFGTWRTGCAADGGPRTADSGRSGSIRSSNALRTPIPCRRRCSGPCGRISIGRAEWARQPCSAASDLVGKGLSAKWMDSSTRLSAVSVTPRNDQPGALPRPIHSVAALFTTSASPHSVSPEKPSIDK